MRALTSILVGLVIQASPLLAATSRAEYLTRLGQTPPRDSDAFVALAEWAKGEGLEAEATECYTKAISIDSDNEKARAALGFRRYGTEWVKQGDKTPGYPRTPDPVGGAAPAGSRPGKPEKPAGDGDSAPAPAPAAPAASAAAPAASPEVAKPRPNEKTNPAPEPRPDVEKKEPGESSPPATAGTGARAQGGRYAADLEKKRAWAKAAADKIQATFNNWEDADFLVHTTLPLSSREMKLLTPSLKMTRKTLATLIGAGGSTPIWPSKLQIVLAKSEPEYDRIATIVDGMASAKNPDGLYTQAGHTVTSNPEAEGIARVLGATALDELGGSRKYVGWWLKDGIAELLVAQSPQGQKKTHYQRTMLYAADVIKSEGESLKIFNVLETASYKDKDTTRNHALAMSLVDFLQKKSRANLQTLIKTLKSDAAPEPVAEDSKNKEEFNAFHLSYITFQEKSLEQAFSMPVTALAERWKQYVLAAADQIKSQETQKEKDEAAKQKKANTPQRKGKTGG